jgi:hypothetical protein
MSSRPPVRNEKKDVKKGPWMDKRFKYEYDLIISERIPGTTLHPGETKFHVWRNITLVLGLQGPAGITLKSKYKFLSC